MSFDPVEGIHYIFDRYAFLNQIMEDGKHAQRVDENSTRPEIDKVCALARGMYHPDRQARTGEEMRKAAEQKTMLIADCERFLRDPELKGFYDQKLVEFREKKPGQVSRDGRAIINLSETFFDLGSLLADTVVDTSDFEARVKAMTQYDDSRAAQMKTLYDAMPENAQVKNLYRDALTQKLVYLSLLEDAAWAKVGYMNRKEKMDGFLHRGGDYAKQVEAALQKASERDIETAVEQHGALAITGMARTALQLEGSSVAPPAPGAEAPEEKSALLRSENYRKLMTEFKAAARKNFDIRADYVRDVAKQKQEVLEGLCALSPVETLHPPVAGQTVYDFYLLNPPEDGAQRALFRMTLDVTSGNAGIADTYKNGETLDDLKKAGFARGGFAVTRNAEITDIMIEIGAACERFLDRHEKEQAAQKPPAAPQHPGPGL
jgi:hypothetical protein